MKSLNNKNIWVIGASSGIGAALAKKLSDEGAKVIISARREDKLIEVRKKLSGNIDSHQVLPLDVTDEKAMELAVKKITEDNKEIDSIIFMAATYTPDNKEQTLEQIKKVVDVNLNGVLNLVYFALPQLKKQKESQLVICASVAGYRGLPNGQPYCATKAAIINYAESLYVENKKNNVDVKIICPGFVETPLTDKNEFPMPFIIKPEEAAKRIVHGIKSNVFEIHFPKRFSLFLKILQMLPNKIYLYLVEKVQ